MLAVSLALTTSAAVVSAAAALGMMNSAVRSAEHPAGGSDGPRGIIPCSGGRLANATPRPSANDIGGVMAVKAQQLVLSGCLRAE
jgi:hypothetical protein